MSSHSSIEPLSLAVLISGGGTTLRNLIEHIADGRLDAMIQLVVSSNPTAAGLQLARDANIPSVVVEKTKGIDAETYRERVFGPCREAGVELVCMGGFLKHVIIPDDFANRVINIHPALIPAFCGKGFYGERVHRAVLEEGAKESGCTVHFVDDHYDHGPIILRRSIPVLDDDTPATLQARVFEQECEALPEAIQLFAQGRLRVEGQNVVISEA